MCYEKMSMRNNLVTTLTHQLVTINQELVESLQIKHKSTLDFSRVKEAFT